MGESLEELNIQQDKEQGGRNEVIAAAGGSTHLKEEMGFPAEPGGFGSCFIPTGFTGVVLGRSRG